MSQGLRYGLLAQEVEQVLPELVSSSMQGKSEDEEAIMYEYINYIDMIGILIKANQGQQQEIAKLKTERSAFESRLAGLEQALTNKLISISK